MNNDMNDKILKKKYINNGKKVKYLNQVWIKQKKITVL